MGPTKHLRFVRIATWGVLIVPAIFMFFLPNLAGILIPITWLLFFLCGFLIKAKCEKCGGEMRERSYNTRTPKNAVLYVHIYECKQCGWTYETGIACDG